MLPSLRSSLPDLTWIFKTLSYTSMERFSRSLSSDVERAGGSMYLRPAENTDEKSVEREDPLSVALWYSFGVLR